MIPLTRVKSQQGWYGWYKRMIPLTRVNKAGTRG